LGLGHSMVVMDLADTLDSADTLDLVVQDLVVQDLGVLDSDTLVFIKLTLKTALAAVFFFSSFQKLKEYEQK
jgi:hypothetical protein